MSFVLRWISLLACLLITIVDHLQASYVLRVNLNQYSNAAHSKDNGFCCDQSNPPCSSDCNNRFSFCLQLPSETEGTCSLGQYQSGIINSDSIMFAQQAIVANPVIFQVNSSWLGAINVLVRVEDELGSNENNPIVFSNIVPLSISHNTAVSRISETKDQLLSMRGVFLELNFELECSGGFYGTDCGTMCTPRDDDLGHFTCDSSGNIKCLERFTDISANCTQCLLLEGCSPTGGYCNSTDGCVCREDFTGDFCDIDLNVCRTGEVLCENGGTCVFNQTNFTGCLCPETYGGPTCETDLNICHTGEARCENGGICEYNHTLENDFVCHCLNNFSGNSCEIDLDVCGHTSPCHNNGICVNSSPGNFTCSCTGFEGRTCAMETNECVDVVCRNGGVCKDLHLDYECECSRGFAGKSCEVELDGCIYQNCVNNGTCQNNLGDYTCLCVDEFSGVNCEIQDGANEADLSELIGPIIGGSVASAVLLVIIIFLLIALICLIKQRSRSKPPSSSFGETANTTSKHIISVDNPSFKDRDTIDSKSSFDRFESSRHVPGAHYSHLNPRTGDTSKNKPLAPTSTSVVDLINSIGDYSTLVDSTRTVSTTTSYNDHKYELIAETRLKAHNAHTANGGNPVTETDIDHDYSSLDEADTVIQVEEQEEEEIVLSSASGPGLPNPYESSSSATSPDSARAQSTIERVNYDHLTLKEGIETAGAGVRLTESDAHDYASADCGVYENTKKKNLEVLYANDIPATEALYDTLN